MTPAEQLAAVVAKWREGYLDDFINFTEDYACGKQAGRLNCADEIEPILAELQRAQGRLTLEMVRRVYRESLTDMGGMSLIAFTTRLNTLLSAPTPAANPDCPLCQGLGSWVEGEVCKCVKVRQP
jgi:hypothetical protein